MEDYIEVLEKELLSHTVVEFEDGSIMEGNACTCKTCNALTKAIEVCKREGENKKQFDCNSGDAKLCLCYEKEGFPCYRHLEIYSEAKLKTLKEELDSETKWAKQYHDELYALKDRIDDVDGMKYLILKKYGLSMYAEEMPEYVMRALAEGIPKAIQVYLNNTNDGEKIG